jgi:hypothetical protein
MPGLPFPTPCSQKYVPRTIVLPPVAGSPSSRAERRGNTPANLPEGIPAPWVLPLFHHL